MNRLHVCILFAVFAVAAARAEDTNAPAPAGPASNAAPTSTASNALPSASIVRATPVRAYTKCCCRMGSERRR